MNILIDMFHNIWCLTPHSAKLIESIKNIWNIWNENIFKDVLQLDLSKLCLSCNYLNIKKGHHLTTLPKCHAYTKVATKNDKEKEDFDLADLIL